MISQFCIYRQKSNVKFLITGSETDTQTVPELVAV
jgi:hypothetical protein